MVPGTLLNFTDKQKSVSTYLAVLSGPNCLAGAAEIQGFLLEAAEGADTPLQITTCSLGAMQTVSQKT